MGANKKYWVGVEEYQGSPTLMEAQQNEFAEELPVDQFLGETKLNETNTGRRDFLKFLGFSLSAATLAACETPVIKSIPYVNKPEEITPGVANWYASTYYDGNDYASILVKTREGRPIFIKGNKQFGINGGAINARINSSVLSLYDTARLKDPMSSGSKVSWEAVDGEIMAGLKKVAASGGAIRLLSNTIISPSTSFAIQALEASLRGGDATSPASAEDGDDAAPGGVDFKHVQYDAYSYSAIREANNECFGKDVIPSYDFSKAKAIVSIGADFTSNWLMHNNYIGQYTQTRKPENGTMSKHFQFESLMSVTGSKADVRKAIKPSDEGLVAISIYNHLAKLSGRTAISGSNAEIDSITKDAAEALWSSRNASLVVAGSNHKGTQAVVNAINDIVGSYGNTIDLDKPVSLFQGNDQEVADLVKDMNAGKVKALIVYNSNPAYTLGDSFKAGLGKVGLSVSFAQYMDETASRCKFVCPDNHFLESWNDLNPVLGHYSMMQPAINKLYNTRQAQESMLRWSGKNESYYDFMKNIWSNYSQEQLAEGQDFTNYWNYAIHNGSVDAEMPAASGATATTFGGDLAAAAADIKKVKSVAGAVEMVLYQKTGIGIGNQAQNPWLQEMPDPISKVTWDNYITMAPSDFQAGGYGYSSSDPFYIGQEAPASTATVTVDGKSFTLPVFPSPGQKAGTIGVALGYGRGADSENIGLTAFRTQEWGGMDLDENGKMKPIGVNVFPYASMVGSNLMMNSLNVTVANTGEFYALACTQTHHTLMGRSSVVRETSLGTFKSEPKDAYNPEHTLPVHEGHEVVDKPTNEIDLWNDHPVENIGHRWGMTVDLNTCTGCSACVTACIAENNIPVVGKDEVRRSRELHWMRIDRYYSSDEDVNYKAVKKEYNKEADFDYGLMEIPSENPQVVHMPMMCQHCNHASCETVCPVAATTHSNEGLNQMAYNRCIGTRYCANNCAFKVRRFNWFNYTGDDKFSEINPAQNEISRMVLNPDVTVRTRGVMEKCSLCVQQIQAGKLQAKKEGRPVNDGEIQTACSEGCPTNAITFGDLNDKGSEVSGIATSDRSYRALEEVGVQPNIFYQVLVRNVESEA